jgi:hypothetical protein
MVALYEKLVEPDVPAMIHVSVALQPALPHDQLVLPGRDSTAAGRTTRSSTHCALGDP